MNKLVKPARIAVLFVLMAVILTIYGSALYTIQISDRDEYLDNAEDYIAKVSSVSAARGSILDRNGIPLVINKTVYNVTLSRLDLVDTGRPNEIILELLEKEDTAQEPCPCYVWDPQKNRFELGSEEKRQEAQESCRGYCKYADLCPNVR